MTFSHLSDNNAGFTLIEMMLCICLISIGLLAVSQMQVGSMKGNQKSTRMIMANLESIAAADLILGKNFNAAELANNYTDTLPSSPGISIEYTVTDIAPYGSADVYHSILLTTSWSDNDGTHNIQRILTMLP